MSAVFCGVVFMCDAMCECDVYVRCFFVVCALMSGVMYAAICVLRTCAMREILYVWVIYGICVRCVYVQ